MKILLTGAQGQVGRALRASAPPNVAIEAFGHAELDISDARSISRAVRECAPDLIVNAAGYTAVDRAESEPDLAARANALGPRNLAGAAAEIGARLIHISTDFVFDGAAGRPYAPEAPTHPLSVYGRTKRAGEEAVLDVLSGRSVVLRSAWIYAASGQNFLLTLLRILRERGTARVVADQVGTPTSAGSLARAIWSLSAFPQLSGIHHFTDAGVASWYDFAVAIAEEAAQLGLLERTVSVQPITTEDYPTAARRPTYSVLDCRSLAPLGLARLHWRNDLRAVLREVAGG